MPHRLPTKCRGGFPSCQSTAFPTFRLVPVPADMHPYRMPRMPSLMDNANGHDEKIALIYNTGLMSLGNRSFSLFPAPLAPLPHFSKYP